MQCFFKCRHFGNFLSSFFAFDRLEFPTFGKLIKHDGSNSEKNIGEAK